MDWVAGQRVLVEGEGPGTVVRDNGFGRGIVPGTRLDAGVDVRVDGVELLVSAAHVQVSGLVGS